VNLVIFAKKPVAALYSNSVRSRTENNCFMLCLHL